MGLTLTGAGGAAAGGGASGFTWDSTFNSSSFVFSNGNNTAVGSSGAGGTTCQGTVTGSGSFDVKIDQASGFSQIIGLNTAGDTNWSVGDAGCVQLYMETGYNALYVDGALISNPTAHPTTGDTLRFSWVGKVITITHQPGSTGAFNAHATYNASAGALPATLRPMWSTSNTTTQLTLTSTSGWA